MVGKERDCMPDTSSGEGEGLHTHMLDTSSGEGEGLHARHKWWGRRGTASQTLVVERRGSASKTQVVGEERDCTC